jgi:hypothetical protein
MPSPFPGVDPYIEAKGLWESFHAWLIPACAETLNSHLPNHYVAEPQTRISLVSYDDPASQRLPDVMVSRRDNRPSHQEGVAAAGVATIEAATIPLAKQEVEIRERWVEIYQLPDMELVTAIEILSPVNKVGSGRSDYLEKRNALIDQPVNLVEIDLLLTGRRMPMARILPPGDFFAIVARAECRPDAQVYVWTLRQPMPPVPIPLRVPDADVALSLAEVFQLCYDRGAFNRIIRYGIPLPASLRIPPEDRAWAESIAR